MKRLRSSEDLNSYGKESSSNQNQNPHPNPNPNRPSVSSHRSFYYRSDNVRKGLLSSSPSSASRYDCDRSVELHWCHDGETEIVAESPAFVRGESRQDSNGPPKAESEVEVLQEKVTKQVIKEGHGSKPSKYSTCFVHYRGWTEETKHKFEDTWLEQQPIEIILGKEKKDLAGLAIGVSHMKAGERALLHVGWELGYGEQGNISYPNVPPKADLVYEVELIGFDETKEGKIRGDMTVEERIGVADRRKMNGNALFKEDKLEEAMQQYSMAISCMGDDFMFQLFGKYRDMAMAIKNPCHLNMAACLIKLKRYDEAIEECTIVLAEDENNVKALLRRGKARMALGQTDAAREDFLKAQKYAPEDKSIARECLNLYVKESSSNQNQNPHPNSNPNRPSVSSHRSFYYKSDNVRKGLLSSPSSTTRYDWDRSMEDEREGLRMVRKRSEHDFDGFDRRKGFDRYNGGGGDSRGYDRSLMHRSASFSGPRREFPKGFRSERDRPRREGSVTSWRRIGVGNKEFDEVGGSRNRLEERGKGLRDVRSPTRSGSEQSRARSPLRGLRDERSMSVSASLSKSISKSKSKSPTWSKDSVGSKQSKCVEVRKNEEVQAESGSSSEMEEGELEPEPKQEIPEPDLKMEDDTTQKAVTEVESERKEAPVQVLTHVDNKEVQSECRSDKLDKGEDELSSKEKVEMKETDKNSACEEIGADNEVGGSPSYAENVVGAELSSGSNASSETSNAAPEISNEGGDERDQDSVKADVTCKDKGEQVAAEKKCAQSDAECMEENGRDLEVKAMDVEGKGLDKEITEENTVPEEVVEKEMTENLAQSFKDKGKGVAVTPAHVEESVGNFNWTEREARDLMTCRDKDVEGPSSRGFELFGSSPVRRQEKVVQSSADTRKEEKLGLEPLDLTLSLPNVLLPIGGAPGSPGRATSVQSMSNTFRTSSDGFTASVSYSGSQSFYHNPSCSLTQNSLDNLEQSVKSRPIFQGIDWQALSQNEPKNKDVPLYQRILMNGNNSQFQPNASTQSSQTQHSRLPEGSSKVTNGLERQLSFHKQLSGHLRPHDDVKSPSHSIGSHDIGSSYSHDRKRLIREKSSGSLYRSSSSKMEQEQLLTNGTDFVETVIGRIVAEPIQSMARKFHEMTGQSLACLKDSIRAILLSPDKRPQLSAIQKILQDRSDMTLEMLQKSHRTQLEILVALKTGVPEFLQQDMGISSLDLAEIFMNLRCRNPACRSHLPVDECDCKVCGQKNGFCSSCMCLVCSKFDMASNTCSWVGCDVCLHWCHADCGLRESYIRNGRSATGSHGSSEMQFHCVACDHPSEMFGFVKEVFQNFAKDWTAETLSKELEYVKRIFSASTDFRGRRLHEIAGQMLARLTNKSDLPAVYNYIMAFLNDSDSFKLSSSILPASKEQSKVCNGIAGPSQEPSWLNSIYTEKIPQLDIPASLLPSYSYDQKDKRAVELELQTSTQKEPLFDELESIVRVKLAEAKLFQTRADDARREAEGLQRIALAKNEKIDEEYSSRILKLRLAEAEQTHKQKFEELQALEQAHREYFNMKMRMEAEIKDLLVKMEATKRNLAA